MRRKPFGEMKSIDDGLRQAFLEHHGRPPDNFVESAEGGAVDGKRVAKESPTEEMRLVESLEDRLRELKPGDITKDDKFKY